MVYRVIRTENGSSTTHDFDDLKEAKDWIDQESYLDSGLENRTIGSYKLLEISDEVG